LWMKDDVIKAYKQIKKREWQIDMNLSTNVPVRKISSQSELDLSMNELLNTLSRAFFNDPYYVYIMPDEKKRLSQLRWWMRIMLKYGVKNGEVYVTSDLKGASFWFGPDNPTIDNLQLAFSGLLLYPFKVGISNFFRMLDISTRWEKIHNKQNPRNYYLMIIGVDPDYQRKGYGSLLMDDIFNRADRKGIICYLETVTHENTLFYRKHNFKSIWDESFGDHYRYWVMTRDPQNNINEMK
jgi:ribosomal protein S18 acetylase RimI-like enzyme